MVRPHIAMLARNRVMIALTLSALLAGCGSGVTNSTSSASVSHTIAGSVTGLSTGQSVTLLDNGGDAVSINANGGFTFPTAIGQSGSYAVTVGTQPAGATCSIAGSTGSGTGVTANVTNVSVSCSANSYTIAGTISGLASGQSVVLSDNGANPLTVSANGSFAFSQKVAYNGSYAVSVATQPVGQTCTVGSATGAGVTSNVNAVAVVCSTSTYAIGGTVSGLASGQQVTLDDNGGDALTV